MWKRTGYIQDDRGNVTGHWEETGTSWYDYILDFPDFVRIMWHWYGPFAIPLLLISPFICAYMWLTHVFRRKNDRR
jgi:hypothetical protein